MKANKASHLSHASDVYMNQSLLLPNTGKNIEKVYGNKNKMEIKRKLNQTSMFDPKYATMSIQDKQIPWNG